MGKINASANGLGDSLIGNHMEEVQNKIKDALGGSLGDHYKSRDHMRDVLGTNTISDEVIRRASSRSTTRALDRYLSEYEEPGYHSVLDHLPRLPPIAPNPIHETNEHLADLGEKIDALVDLQAKQADLIDKLLAAQIANEASQKRAGQRGYWLNIVNIVLATSLAIAAIVVAIILAK